LVITIDGPVAAGKTSAARRLAARLRFTLLDTGAIYRCVALDAQGKGLDWHDESALSGVRTALLALQRQQATASNVIAEGRDTGTVVFPGAELKFFLTATPEIRARRRFLELVSQGIEIEFRDVLTALRERDHRDSSRSIAPLIPAADAVTIDSSSMTADNVVAQMQRHVPDDFLVTDP